jgi:hypothetical protein
MTGNTVKITELTISYTNVGGIGVAVYLPGNFIGSFFVDVTQLIPHKNQIGS